MSFEERARARKNWPIRVFKLGEEPLVDARDTRAMDERVANVATLTRMQWALANLPLPTYTRAEIPGVITRKKSRG